MLFYHHRHLRHHGWVGLPLAAVMVSPGCCLGTHATACTGLSPCAQSAECAALNPPAVCYLSQRADILRSTLLPLSPAPERVLI